jgi:hypothetical protein
MQRPIPKIEYLDCVAEDLISFTETKYALYHIMYAKYNKTTYMIIGITTQIHTDEAI